jgi:hypothetical protein
MPARLSRTHWVLVVSAVVLLGAGLTWWLWPRADHPAPPLARPYQDVNACLLTDDRGVQGAPAAAVWAGMQEASASTGVRVEYLTVAGAQTPENAQTFLATLAQARCALVFVTGDAPAAALDQAAQRFPDQRFVSVGRPGRAPNVSTVDDSSPEALRASASRLVAGLASARPVR